MVLATLQNFAGMAVRAKGVNFFSSSDPPYNEVTVLAKP